MLRRNDTKKQKQVENITKISNLSIGELIYKGLNHLYYEGIVADSVVFGVSNGNKAFIPMNIKEFIKIPYSIIEVKLDSVDKETGKINIQVKK